jgi:hypothetical protein
MKYMKQLLPTCFLCLIITHSFSQEADHKINLNELDFLLGKWKVESSQRLSAQGPWEKTNASSIIGKTLNSTLIEEEFTGSREGKPFLIKTLFAINNANNKYQRVFADSEHGVLIEFEGEKNKDTLYFDRTWRYTNGSTVKLRVAYYIISQNEFHIESMRMPQQATEWDITGRMKYTKTE